MSVCLSVSVCVCLSLRFEGKDPKTFFEECVSLNDREIVVKQRKQEALDDDVLNLLTRQWSDMEHSIEEASCFRVTAFCLGGRRRANSIVRETDFVICLRDRIDRAMSVDSSEGDEVKSNFSSNSASDSEQGVASGLPRLQKHDNPYVFQIHSFFQLTWNDDDEEKKQDESDFFELFFGVGNSWSLVQLDEEFETFEFESTNSHIPRDRLKFASSFSYKAFVEHVHMCVRYLCVCALI